MVLSQTLEKFFFGSPKQDLEKKPNYELIRNLEIELGFEPYPELPPGAQLYGTGTPNLAVVDKILKDMYVNQH